MSVRGIKPIVREPSLTAAELAALPDDRATIEPFLTLEQEIALLLEQPWTGAEQ